VEELWQLVKNLHVYDEIGAISPVLVIVDLVLIMNLVLMIVFVGYMNFISLIHPQKREDWSRWMGSIGLWRAQDSCHGVRRCDFGH
jgi:uncharacterized protein (TIGR00645 family)